MTTGRPVSRRALNWRAFAERVFEHIEKYTVAQYGDAGQDQVTHWTPEQVVENMRRYLNRAGKNARGPEEEERDALKLAHYANLLWEKLRARRGVV